MVPTNSLDEYELIAALLCDLSKTHGAVFNTQALSKTLRKVKKRVLAEGLGFLTKTLPRLGKHLDRCLSGTTCLNGNSVGFETLPGSQLPRFLGELFSQVFQQDGTLHLHPCADCVRSLRQILFVFYKYELPYTNEQELQVLDKFEKTDSGLSGLSTVFAETQNQLDSMDPHIRRSVNTDPTDVKSIVREARILLQDLFAFFDPYDIHPRHGPGVVATKQQPWDKYLWSNVSGKITDVYPLDAFFFASLGHVCDSYHRLESIGNADLPARVLLVPKDSRGPRLISCEPVDYQWIQQGLGRAIVSHVESHPVVKHRVRFTSQRQNQIAALYGSRTGKYATLDLNEASDRVSLDLVRLLFPPHLYRCLEACRSSSTLLPSGKQLTLNKFAPMGSCLCFPVLALTIWSLLTAGTVDADTRESIYVYGDDVIVPTTYVARAIELLESFGLKINRDKSCTSGLFRESCGMDAFNGIDVTPVRFRTVWSSLPSPEVYTSWIAYANSLHARQYYNTYELIVGALLSVYREIPEKDMHLACPSLVEVPVEKRPKRRRLNRNLQKLQYRVWDVKSPSITKTIDGWSMLLRFFAESSTDSPLQWPDGLAQGLSSPLCEDRPFAVSQYTRRNTSMLVKRWR